MVLFGREAVASTRALVGSTDPAKALPGTIRGDFGARGRCHKSDRVDTSGAPKVCVLDCSATRKVRERTAS